VITIALVAGIVLAFAFLMSTRKQPDGGARLCAVGLVVTTLMYVAFALIGGASARSLGLDTAASVGFGRSAALLALGWALHVVWDVSLYRQRTGAGYTPDWYPWAASAST
jgi:hypothetical protein